MTEPTYIPPFVLKLEDPDYGSFTWQPPAELITELRKVAIQYCEDVQPGDSVDPDTVIQNFFTDISMPIQQILYILLAAINLGG